MVPYGQKVTHSRKKGFKKFQQKNLKKWTKWNRKMGGRSFYIPSGAFGDTLMGMSQDYYTNDPRIVTPPLATLKFSHN